MKYPRTGAEDAAFHGEEAENLLLHVVQLRSITDCDVVPDQVLRGLEARLRDLPDSVAPTTAWRPADLATVVHLPLRHGAFPLAHTRAVPLAAALGGRVGITAHGLLRMHLDDLAYPSFISAFREAAPDCLAAHNDTAALAPSRPFTLPIAPGPSTLGASRALLRLALPYGDRHLERLVQPGGQATCADVVAALSDAVGGTAIAHCGVVNARVPGTTQYTFMVRIRVVPNASGAMAEAFLGTPAIHVGGTALAIFPVTHIRDPLRDLPGPSRARMALLEATQDTSTRGRLRHAVHPQVHTITNLSSVGLPTGEAAHPILSLDPSRTPRDCT